MALKLQRVTQGLLNLLGTQSGGQAPSFIEESLRGVIDVTQTLGTPQTEIASGTIAEGAVVSLTVPDDRWWVLYAASTSFTLTTTLTGLVSSLRIFRTNQASVILAAQTWWVGPFAAGRTDVPMATWTAPYPWLLAPGTALSARADVIGTDANVAMTLRARVAPLG